MKCPACGTTNPDDRVTCRRCKAPLNDAAPADVSAGPTIVAPPREPQPAPDNSSFGGPTIQAHSTPLPDEPSGTIFAGRYEIVELLGRGGMGVVYRVRDLRLGRDVALKRLHAQQESGRLGIERFVQEARAIAALNHRNIVTVHEFVEPAPGPFIVMEYLPGGDLARRLRERGKLEPAEALEIVRLVGQALAYAHRRSIFHRDVKPSNIIVAEDGTPKLVDFGLAHLANESELTLPGQGMGTSAFMAPEQKRDARNADHRSDIFALAKTFYCLVTGEVPDSPDLDEVPASMRPAMKKALKLRPEERPFSVEEFLQELDAPATAGPVTVLDLPGTCPQCGKPNPETVRFCRACGAGLFDKCPACGAEDRIGIKHCGSCGVNIGKYKESAAALAAARKHMEEFRYSRAVKEADRGLQAGYIEDDLRKLRTEAAAKADRLEALKAEAAKLVEQEKYEEAEGRLKEALQLDPNQEELEGVLKELPARITRREVDKLRVVITNFIPGMKLVYIPRCPQGFMMGSPANETHRNNDEAQHRVTLTKGFYMATTEVTQAQWQAVMGNNPSYFNGDDLPVELVLWHDATEFCRKLSEKEGKRYRLPTEAEWEYACRAGTTGPYAGTLDSMAWYTSNSGDKTHPVATKQANAWGLFDMHGNVWEWCQSQYKGYPYRGDDGRESLVDKTVLRVLRGGSWTTLPRGCRSAGRSWGSPSHRNYGLGFRVCLDSE